MTSQTATVGFREANSPDVWRIEVVVDGVVSGHIYCADGTYRCFEGPLNDVTWSSADLDLERLEARIRATVIAGTPPGRPCPAQSQVQVEALVVVDGTPGEPTR